MQTSMLSGKMLSVEELKNAVFRCFDRGDIARQDLERGAKLSLGLAENPPVAYGFRLFTSRPFVRLRSAFTVSRRLLIHLGKPRTDLVRVQAEKVDNHDATRRSRRSRPLR